MIHIKILILLFLILNMNFITFAGTNYNGTYNPVNWNDESFGEGQVSWLSILESLSLRLDKELIAMTDDMEDFYTYKNLVKEMNYYYYVFTTNGRDYNEYYNFVLELLKDYKEHGILSIYPIKSKEDYLNDANLYGIYRNYINIDTEKLELVADSGFLPINALPVYNFGISKIEEIGNCAGLDLLSVLSYKKDELLKGFTFESVSIMDNKKDINFIDLSDYNPIISGKAGLYIPDSEHFKSIYKDNYLRESSSVFPLNDFYGTDDYNIVTSVLLLQKWASKNFSSQTAYSLPSIFLYTQEEYCPDSELDLLIDELNSGNPLLVTVTSKDSSGHNLIGYQLYKNKLNSNFYYLRVVDTNLRNESYLFVIFYINEGKLYALYSPLGLYAKNKYVYDKKVECTSFDGKLLHKSNTLFWDKDYNPKILPY